jgi:DNA-binding MarR family transcriptional regulator
MHSKTMFTKTPKGVQELENRTMRLPRDLGLVFLAVDGRRSVAELMQKAGMDESSLVQALDRLVANGYIKVSYEPLEAEHASSASDDFDLDFTIPPRGFPLR